MLVGCDSGSVCMNGLGGVLCQVISEDAYLNWKDDIEDPTPGRDEVSSQSA